MKKLLLVTKNGKSTDALMEYMNQIEEYTAEAVYSAKEAQTKLLEGLFDLVIINSPLEEEVGDNLAICAVNHSSAGVIVLLKNEDIERVAEKMEQYGIIIVNKPVVKAMLSQAIKFAQLAKNRITTLQEENLKLQSKIDEMKLVNRAKWVLVQYLSMSEEQAHKYIEHQAMNRRVSKKKIAEKILKTYDH
ncbi:ANTAR domain-containing response regulator [Clostridium aminobutyricum]|uniref:ANTAR domain-containing protein n=1 Tax=Clostridium aminobutyricum TaxID=33953 RepID=A0A939D818_CLOAM|nr:ANTAR domain-containing protein [Clostridium aminobutyricum]MBN7772815.1 ANTAR domain-containing protein [Clostridium aminobutyricum]